MTTRRRLAASVLSFEALMVLFAIAVAIQLSDVRPTLALAGGFGLAGACLLAAGSLRHRWGFALGTAVQVLVLASGLVVPAMWLLGAVFAGLWLLALWLGARAITIERDRGY